MVANGVVKVKGNVMDVFYVMAMLWVVSILLAGWITYGGIRVIWIRWRKRALRLRMNGAMAQGLFPSKSPFLNMLKEYEGCQKSISDPDFKWMDNSGENK